MIKTITFDYKDDYTVEADYIDTPPKVSSPHLASCPEDYLGERELIEVSVYNQDGDDVSDDVIIPDELVWYEIDIMKETCKYEEDIRGLSMRYISDEKIWYMEN